MTLAKVGQKVKITNCSHDNVWYRDYIGQEFTVEEVIERKGINNSKGYYILEGNNFCGVEEQLDNFKSGDKVIITKKTGWYEVGETYTLTKPFYSPHGDGWRTLEKGSEYFIHIENMKPYFTSPKSMLQNGMRVKLRNGCMYTYIDGYFTNISPVGNGLVYLSEVDSWADDLQYYRGVDVESEWDVIEIFAAPNIYDYFKYKIKTRSLWVREEKSAKQLQLEALQKQAQEVADAIKKLQDEE